MNMPECARSHCKNRQATRTPRAGCPAGVSNDRESSFSAGSLKRVIRNTGFLSKSFEAIPAPGASTTILLSFRRPDQIISAERALSSNFP